MLTRREFDPVTLLQERQERRWLWLSGGILIGILAVVASLILASNRAPPTAVPAGIVAVHPGVQVTLEKTEKMVASFAHSGDFVKRSQPLLLVKNHESPANDEKKQLRADLELLEARLLQRATGGG